MQPIDLNIRNEIMQVNGNVVISASAGTGKTHITVERIRTDIERCSDFHTYAAITFTRKASKEIEQRLGNNKKDGVISTNDHFVLMEIIQPFMKDVYGDDFKKEITPDYSNDNAFFKFEEGIEKIRLEGFMCKYNDQRKNFAFQLALNILQKSSAAMLYLQAKYYRIYIDEYQDSDKDMHKLFMYIYKELYIPLFIVGDKKQSIYGWRGGYKQGFEEIILNKDFNEYRLIQNFRSTIAIQNYSNMFMDDVRENYQIERFDNSIVCYAFLSNDVAIQYIKKWTDFKKKCAFLIRRNNDARLWYNMLKNIGTDFTFIPGSPLDNTNMESEHIWISRLIAMYLLKDHYSEYDFYYEIPNSDAYNFGKITKILKEIKEQSSLAHDFEIECKKLYELLGYVQNEKIINEINELFKVIVDEQYYPTYNSEKFDRIITTIHSSKGLEYNQVIVLANDYNLDVEDDLYLHYVAVSRPKERLLILDKYENGNGKKYIKKIKENVSKLCELGFGITLDDVVKGVNSEELQK